MIVYIDIDETIAKTPDDRNYSLSKPITKNIEKAYKKVYQNYLEGIKPQNLEL